ncbi:STAS/SEC14 domain-containing protein [Mucilaginibacter limnophilus]|uniref:STAS/SEC14 domain-containing protein n=1 Tax=Mucilaginibacter limnophilus TaxID=1932778 RepID=A0A3S2UNX4_9SPHI|nr:STAS/SEC14 domain-containing protein [Mucilaginibacter limnophilus]RVU03114.1 STAS/SEC14 domain-containing protein [Mucilaginibacter limnophilus]
MLRKIGDMPEHVLGIHAVDEVRKEDIEKVLIPGLRELVDKQGAIHYLLIIETNIRNFTAGALLQDIKAGLKYYGKWKKIAIVTDQKGVAWFSSAFRLFIPGKSKGFPLNKLDEAVIWVSAKN